MLVDVADQTEGKYVFPQNQSLAQLFNRILERAGIAKQDNLGRKLVAHSFRHTYATMMSEVVGGNPFILKQALGHSQISTTDRYCHPHVPAEVIDISPFCAQDECKSGDAAVGTVGKTEQGKVI